MHRRSDDAQPDPPNEALATRFPEIAGQIALAGGGDGCSGQGQRARGVRAAERSSFALP